MEVMQERAGAPSMCTVQAPHSAMPQPNLVPVMPKHVAQHPQQRRVAVDIDIVCRPVDFDGKGHDVLSSRVGNRNRRRHSRCCGAHAHSARRLQGARRERASAARSTATSVTATSMLPRVAFEYGQFSCASSTRLWATSRAIPGKLTLNRARSDEPPSASRRSTSASITGSAGSTIFRLLAASAIALSKQADHAVANNCSGLVPMRAEPGAASLTSR